MPISRRQGWRPWPAKDPASEVTAIRNEQIRGASARITADTVLRRQGQTIQLNALLRRRLGVKLQITTRNAVAFKPTGGQIAAMRARRQADISAAAAARLLRQNAWLQPYDPTTYVGEVYLTESSRAIAFVEAERKTLTEVARVTAFVEDR